MKIPPSIDFGPKRIRLTPTRWGWNSAVVDELTTTSPPWWRPTKAGARRVAARYLRRLNYRETCQARSVEEAA